MVEDMDKILEIRYQPQARSHLAERIIDASKTMPKQKPRPADCFFELAGWFEVLGQSLVLPRPVVVMALVLLLGAGFGLYLGADQAPQENPFQIVYVEDGFNTGSWL